LKLQPLWVQHNSACITKAKNHVRQVKSTKRATYDEQHVIYGVVIQPLLPPESTV